MKSYRSETVEAGEKTADATVWAMLAFADLTTLPSYLVEGEPVVAAAHRTGELASRLSYFLWSSMPDDGLFDACQDGSIECEELEQKWIDVGRSRIERFRRRLCRQWLATCIASAWFPPTRDSTLATTRG